jgi:TonB family protein
MLRQRSPIGMNTTTPIALQSVVLDRSMSELVKMILAVAIPISSIIAATQSPQRNSQIPASSSDRKGQKVYHVGGNVKPPRVISSFQPSLTEEQAKQLNAGNKVVKTGSTIVGIVVGEDGTVQSAKVLQSLSRDLDAKAIDAVKQWKFEPATKKGVPVAVELAVEVDFHLYK